MKSAYKRLSVVFTCFILVFMSSMTLYKELEVKAEGTVYYVSTTGSAYGDGSIDKPMNSIQEAIYKMKPGDTLILRGGEYLATVDVLNKNGSEISWYTIKNYPGEVVTMTGGNKINWLGKSAPDAITFNKSSYWKVEGIRMKDYTGAGIYITGKSHHIEMTNLNIYNLDYPTDRPYGTSGIHGEDSSYCTVRNCEIYNVGLKINKPKDHGIYIGYGAYNWVFDSNKIHDNAGAAIQMYGAPNGGSNCTIINNFLYNNHAYGMAIGSNATNNYIYNNVFYGNSFDDIYMLEGAYSNWFRNNLFLTRYSNYNVQLSDASSVNNSFDSNVYYKVNGIVANRYNRTLNFNEWKSYSQEYSGQYINDINTAQALINNWTPASIKKYSSKRLSGLDRFETAKKIAEEFNSGTVNNIVITSGYNFPNALSGSVLAKKLNAPILLCGNSDYENTSVINYVKDHLSKSGTVYILGDNLEVSDKLIQKIKDLGYNNIKRLSGNSKYESIKSINDEVNAPEGTPIIIAGGNVFADGLSVSTIAASNGYPIVLSDVSSLSQSAKDSISKIKPSKIYLVGGTGVVSENIKDEVKSMCNLTDDNIIRIWGMDRYETSLNIVKYFNPDGKMATFASGENFPDALAGSVYAAKYSAPVILINDNMKQQKIYIDSKKYTEQVIFGGTGVVNDVIKSKLMR